MDQTVEKLIKLLPRYVELNDILKDFPEANYILEKALNALKDYAENENKCSEDELEECGYLGQALVDKSWELIHTGSFCDVPLETRMIYAIACFCKIIFSLIEGMDRQQLESCSKIFDEAILIGYTRNLFANSQQFMQELTDLFNRNFEAANKNIVLPVIEVAERENVNCDILELVKPTLPDFEEKCFKPQKPALLLNTFDEWPALKKWCDLNYILKLAGNRTVPIEIGSNYATEEWSQQLIQIKDFLQRQFGEHHDNTTVIEYLAQHELFEQIPSLKKDFTIPEYCSMGTNKEPVDIKAWLGPKGTISPMHYDPKHNLLCQVFGSKSIILASSEDSTYLYPHEGEFLTNTSQIDAANVDYDKFPETSKVKFYKLKIQPGDCLYIPPKWWHYVRSESPSFSVSFWWE